MSEKRKNEAKISLVKSSYRIFAAIVFVMLVCPLSFCLLIIFSSSEFYHSLDKGECARTFQQVTNETYHFSIPNQSTTAITHDNVIDLVEVYRIRPEDHIVQANSDEFMPASIWLKSNHEAILINWFVAGINSDVFALHHNAGLTGMPFSLRICSTIDGSQLDFLYRFDPIVLDEIIYPANDRPHIILKGYTQQITNKYYIRFWDDSEKNILLELPADGALYDYKFSDDRTTVCALTEFELICWGVPSDE